MTESNKVSFHEILFKEAPIAILFAQDHNISYVNPHFLEVFGYDNIDELIGLPATIMYPENLRQSQLERGQNRALGIKEPKSYEMIGQKKDGTKFPMQMNVSDLLIDENIGLIAFITDMSQVKQIEKERNVNLGQYQTIFEKAPLGIVISRQTLVLFCNENFAQMFGYEVSGLIGTNVYKIISEKEREKIISRGISREAGGDEPPIYTSIGLNKANEEFAIRIEVTPIKLPDGNALLVFMQDISDQAQAEQALIESEERNRILLESAPEAIVVMDVGTGLFVDANKNAQELFKLSKEKILTCGPLDLSPKYLADGKLAAPLVEEKIKEALQGGTPSYEWIHINSVGTAIPCEIRLVKLPSKEGILLRGSIIDISERKNAEVELQKTREQLFQAQKMETIGRITGGIAHDFNNMLTGIIGYTEILLSQIHNDDRIKEQVTDIKQIATKAATLTGELLSFSRKRVFRKEVLNLNTVIKNQIKILNTVTRENVEIKTNFERNLKNIQVDKTYLEQVIMNLCINAKDAMEPQGGILTIKTSNVSKDEIRTVYEHEKNDRFVLLSVTDDGIGMDELVKEHIFEPFFSTKTLGKGTGLGLATVHGIVNQNKGYIDVISEIGRGSTFLIYFPSVELSLSNHDVEEQAPYILKKQRKDQTILLVDDDKIVLDVVHKILVEYGYEVISTDKPNEAVLIAERDAKMIDMILTDVIMPKMSGQALVKNILKIKPEMRVLFMSGNTSDIYLYDEMQREGYLIIEKPFTSQSLLEKIEKVLSG